MVRIVDDDMETRELLRGIAAAADLDVETYGDAAMFMRSFDPQAPGCLVVDARLHGVSGVEIQRQLAARKVSVPVIVTTRHGDVPMAVEAMRAGAFDVVEKPLLTDSVLASIRRAVEHDLRRRSRSDESAQMRVRYSGLTEREREVLRLVAAGMTSKTIASQLTLQEKTVEVYRSRVKRKMGARNSADLVRMMHTIT